ncbi:hypothetical protein VTN02DRAFT_896 [Thermoascus thermophilus]
MSGREADKGHRYIAALDEARCQDRWSEVPELLRKVTKHSPQRKCLIQTATAEHQVVTHLASKRPTSAGSSTSAPDTSILSELIPTLLSAIEEAAGEPQDIFQAQVCLAWVHYLLSETGLAATRLPNSIDETVQSLTGDGHPLSPWTEVCLIKGCYIKGAAQSLISQEDEALQTFTSALSRLSESSQASTSPQFSLWSEKLLGKGALLAGEKASSRGDSADEEAIGLALKWFRSWAAHPAVREATTYSSASQVIGPGEPASRASVWKSYYDFLSAILQQGLPYVPPSEGPNRVQLSSEIRRVESGYESHLLKEVRFPTANAKNSQVEAWVEQVIRNWEVFCGPDWRDGDIEGGQDAVGRHVLDILYRAATKTYHSHLILRRLFHVHSSLAEFDLAMKALDSYVEIVISAKDRAEKAAESGELEDDGVLLQTVSEGVITLSCFGSRKEAEKAKSLIEILQKYVEKHLPEDFDPVDESKSVDSRDSASHYPDEAFLRVIAMAFRAIGIGLATWARWTPVNEDRDDMRAEAIEYLERSLAPELGDQHNVASIYALTLLLSETRDIDTAIDYIRSALAWNSYSLTSREAHEQATLSTERDLVPLWHLLALLLSAKQEFDMAGRSCETAFEQFPSTVPASFGHTRSRKHQHALHDSEDFRTAFIGQLRGREKERIIETRMTQLALLEVSEGPEAALNHSDQLLSLFATLFADLNLQVESQKKPNTENAEHLVPPKSPSGTVRSFRSGIFGRKKKSHITDPTSDVNIPTTPTTPTAIPPNMGTAPADDADAPAIQVTGDQGVPKERSRSKGRRDSIRQKFHKHEGSFAKAVRPGSRDAKSGGAQDVNPPQPIAEGPVSPETVGIAVSEPTSPTSPTNQYQSAKQPLPPISHNMRYKRQPPPLGHSQQPPEQDVRLPGPHRFESPTRALTRFPVAHAQKHALCILVKIWLFIAGLYRRASLFDDAREACDEASKQADRVEVLVAAQESSARAFAEYGWGAGKSSEEVWADVHAERGALAQAQSLPHEAMDHYEEAIMHYPDHPKATVRLANLLLDIWDETLPPEPAQPKLEANLSSLSLVPQPSKPAEATRPGEAAAAALPNGSAETKPQSASRPTPSSTKEAAKSINRLAARDRAYGLLSTLTKLGSSWDNSEAWLALARVYEAGGQIEKAKEVLWWCVELEDRRPVRHWSNLGSGGYVL